MSVEADGESGPATLRNVKQDLVVLAVMMPALTGIDVCHALRSDPRTAGIAAMLLTARAQRNDIKRSRGGSCRQTGDTISVREVAALSKRS